MKKSLLSWGMFGLSLQDRSVHGEQEDPCDVLFSAKMKDARNIQKLRATCALVVCMISMRTFIFR